MLDCTKLYTADIHYIPSTETLCTIHCSTVYFTALPFTVGITLDCTTVHCTALHYTALHYSALHYTVLHCTTHYSMHYTALHYTALHYTALHYNALHGQQKLLSVTQSRCVIDL